MDAYTQLLIYLAGPAILGVIGGLITVWRELQNHKLHVAENYVKRHDIEEIKVDTKEMLKLVHQIAGKVGVRTDRE